MSATSEQTRPTRPPPRSRTNGNGNSKARPGRGRVEFGKIAPRGAERICLVGSGGIGKTTLSASAPGPVAFFDLDGSLPVLGDQLTDHHIKVVEGVTTWNELRAALNGDGWDDIKTIVIDSATKAEELATAWVLDNVPHEKGHKVSRVEDYGYGKGYGHIYDAFLLLLGDLDQHIRAGRYVNLVCHDCVTNVPNPNGDDWIRYEPRLQNPASGKWSIRLRVREWVDHLLFLGYDIAVKDGKGQGTGTRTIYPNELPHCMAKSRTLDEPIAMEKNSTELWDQLFGANDK